MLVLEGILIETKLKSKKYLENAYNLFSKKQSTKISKGYVKTCTRIEHYKDIVITPIPASH